MTTDADRHLENARERTAEAIQELGEIFVKRCFGHDEYKEEYRERYRRAFTMLMDAADLLRS